MMTSLSPSRFALPAVQLPPPVRAPIPFSFLVPTPDPVPASSPTAASILVVDDDPSILLMVREILEFEGYRVETAINGAEGLAKTKQKLPDLILLDMRMPVLDGWGVARRLQEEGIVVPVVVITAAQNAQQWATEVGAVDHLDKPFDLGALLEVVERWCPHG